VNVLVVGASGSVGRYVASELGRSPEVTVVLVASRRARTAEKTARLLGGPSDRVRPVTLDVTETESTLQAFREADVVVSAAGPSYLLEEPAVAAAVETGTPYLSLADDLAPVRSVRALDESAVANETTIVTGCGLAPGLSNLLVDLCARGLDAVEEIDIAVARSAAESDGDASAMHFLFVLTQPAPVISEFTLSDERAGTAPRLVYFPEPVGWIETFRAGHPEIATLPEKFGDLRSLQYRVGLTEKAAMDVTRAAVASKMVRSEGARRAFLKASGPLRPLVERMPPKGPAWTALRVDVRGQRDGRQAIVSYGAADHLRNFASVPISLLAVKIGSGQLSVPGVHTVDEVVDSGSFLAEIGQRGVRVAKLEAAQV
jgi:saccharopine dehydrogenase-like NADP-dependent oxidoreductase